MPEIPAGTDLSVLHYIAFALAWLGGILTRFAQQVNIEKIDFRQYFVERPMLTAASLCISLAITIVLFLQGETNIITYFSVTFVAETLINKNNGGKAQ